jgi:hypothetical protein
MKLTGDDKPLAQHVMVFLNGKLCKRHIYSADEERGELIVYAENEDGHLFPDETGSPKKETITGAVEIVLNPNASKFVTEIYNQWRRNT